MGERRNREQTGNKGKRVYVRKGSVIWGVFFSSIPSFCLVCFFGLFFYLVNLWKYVKKKSGSNYKKKKKKNSDCNARNISNFSVQLLHLIFFLPRKIYNMKLRNKNENNWKKSKHTHGKSEKLPLYYPRPLSFNQ